jgi:hypothetical protein
LEKQATNIIKETKQTSAPVPKPVPVPEPVTMPVFTSEPTISPSPAPKPAAPVIIAQPPIQNNAVAAGVPLSTPTVNV